ncbi:hypothetical protein R77560_04789 [Ralstonia thomasii]|uniref:Uncharacterized protein n=2 Tax=Ralstonia TaxID=48736 RepID=A0AAD2BUH6_9RALS|nr:hypothetical protein [Ralstonia sp. LMG 18095]CAJ0808806.1 hypothetical protein R77560_04789 [Ralstonia sp. LMG 18095]
MSIKEAIDFLKQRGRFDSYAALARAAGMDRIRMQNIRAGVASPSVKEEFALAEACGMKPADAVALLEAAKDPESRSFWKKYSEVFRRPLNAPNRGRLLKA